MTVLPGSLDYLYYNGILDHIPYEAYEMPIAGVSSAYQSMNGSQYLDSAMSGNMYNAYNNQDSFVKNNNVEEQQGYSFTKNALGIGDGKGQDYDFEAAANGSEGKTFRQSIMSAAAETKNSVTNAPNYIKGILGGCLMLGTLFCLLKGKKAPAVHKHTSFWSKLNPKNWFKK